MAKLQGAWLATPWYRGEHSPLLGIDEDFGELSRAAPGRRKRLPSKFFARLRLRAVSFSRRRTRRGNALLRRLQGTASKPITAAEALIGFAVASTGGHQHGGGRSSRADGPIIAVALDWIAPGFANRSLQGFNGLLLGSLGTGHMKNFLFHQSSVQVINPVAQRDLSEGKRHGNPI